MGAKQEQQQTTDLKPKWQRRMWSILWYLGDQWFLIAVPLLIAISSQVQVPEQHQQIKQKIVSYLAMAVIFFVTGCTLKTKTLIENYSRWKLHLFVQIQSFLMTSAIVFAVVSAAATNREFMDPALLVGMIFMSVVPTTMGSNVVMTGQAKGNNALTVVQSTLGNFIGPFITPLLVKLYTFSDPWYAHYIVQAEKEGGGFGEVYRRVFMQLGFSVYLPMVVGQVVQNLFPNACHKVFVQWHMKKLSSFALLTIIWQVFDQAFAVRAFESVEPSNIIFIMFTGVAFFGIFLAAAFATSFWWLPRKDVVSVLYCIPPKTPAMGVPLTNVMFAGLSLLTESKMQIPMILYQVLVVMFSSIMVIPCRKWIEKEEAAKAAEEKARNADESVTDTDNDDDSASQTTEVGDDSECKKSGSRSDEDEKSVANMV